MWQRQGTIHDLRMFGLESLLKIIETYINTSAYLAILLTFGIDKCKYFSVWYKEHLDHFEKCDGGGSSSDSLLNQK